MASKPSAVAPLRGIAVTAIVVAITLALIQALAGGWIFFSARDTVWETLGQSATLQARALAIAVSDELAQKNYAAIETRLQHTMASRGIRAALVTDVNGKVLSYLARTPGQAEATLVFDSVHLTPPPDVDLQNSALHEGDQITRWARIDSGRPIGWVQIKVSTGPEAAAMEKLRKETLALAVLGLVTAAAMLLILLGRVYLQMRARETQIQADHLTLEAAAFHDELTGLANRHLLLDRLHQTMSRSLRSQELLAVCFVDLDGFKAVNDRYGHAVGDLLLREVAYRLSENIRSEDTIARVGGDEFVMVLADNKTTEGCELFMQRVLDAMAKPMAIHGNAITVGASIGVTYYPSDKNDARDAAALLAEADKAMYESKRAGRHRWHTYQATSEAFKGT